MRRVRYRLSDLRTIPDVAILGIDFGSRRIGIAVSESGVLATPHSVVANSGDIATAIDAIGAIGRELGVELYVVGIPRTLRHDAAKTEAKFHQFAEALRQRTCKEVVLRDEALTSVEAEERLRAMHRKRSDIRKRVDMEAAAIILQSYLDERRGRQS